MHTIPWMNPGSNTFGGRSQTQKATSRVSLFVRNSRSGTRTDGSRREQARGFQAWVREGVGTAEARPGSGTGWGPGRLGLGQGGRGDRRGSAWGRDGVGTPVAVRTSSH